MSAAKMIGPRLVAVETIAVVTSRFRSAGVRLRLTQQTRRPFNIRPRATRSTDAKQYDIPPPVDVE